MVPKSLIAVLATSSLAAPALASDLPDAQAAPVTEPSLYYVPAITSPDSDPAQSDDRLALFAPTTDPVRHRIDYEIWDWALKNIVVTMGPSNRKIATRPSPGIGTRIKHGAQSPFRLEGSVVLFRFLDSEVIDSFTAYRQDLERVTETLDIAALPRNEQLAFWFNLHNVALLEQLAREWPVRQPSDVKIDGVTLDDAQFITVRGIPVSLRDIRENIVFRHWKDPKVIYGFWRGEIGGPELQRHAFTGGNVSSLLDVAAEDYVNSLRAVQKRGDQMMVATLYADVAPFYFPDFDRDLRNHFTRYAEPSVAQILDRASLTKASIRERDIADLHGGARPPNYLFAGSAPGAMDDPLVGWSDSLGQAAFELLQDRTRKLQNMKRRGQPTGRVFFSNIDLPGDPPNKNAVE